MYVELREDCVHGTKEYAYTQYAIHDVQRAFQVPVHWHREVEIIYIEQGALQISIGGQQYEGHAGDIFFVHPGELHLMGSEDLNVKYCTILFPLRFISFQTEDALEEQLFGPLRRDMLLFPQKIKEKEVEQNIAKILVDLIKLNQREDAFVQIQTRIYLLQMVEILYKNQLFIKEKKEKKDLLQREMLIFIQNHYQEKLTLKMLSKQFHLSEKYISRYFKQHFFLTFKQYIQHLRLTKAKDLLESSEMSVLEVALEAGFPTVNYFIHTFKEMYEITPFQYKKKYCYYSHI